MSAATRTIEAQARADQARAQLLGTVNRIQDRLSPKALAGEAWGNIRHRGGDIARLALPLATARSKQLSTVSTAITLGAAVLRFFRNRSGRSRVSGNASGPSNPYADHGDTPMTLKDKAQSTREYASEKAQAAREYAAEKAQAAREYASEKTSSARDYASGTAEVAREKLDHARHAAGEQVRNARGYASDAYHNVQDKARSARERVSSDVDSNPLLALVGGIAVGALVALLLPRNRRETETGRFGDIGSNINAKARELAEAARAAGRETLAEAGRGRDAATRAAKDMAERARSATEQVVKQAKDRNIID